MNSDPQFWTAIIGGFGALTTAIGVQWKTTMSHFDTMQKKLDECEDDRKQLWMTVASQCGKDVSELKKGK